MINWYKMRTPKMVTTKKGSKRMTTIYHCHKMVMKKKENRVTPTITHTHTHTIINYY